MYSLSCALSIAPMIDWTNTHFRMFMRMLAPNALLYTDMQTVGAIQHKPQRALKFNPLENPLAMQLGGSHPEDLAKTSIKVEQAGFNEINLNLGCPSDKVQAGRFGVCLMQEPQIAVDCILAMKKVVTLPVTAKVRIGVDHQDSYVFFSDFVYKLLDAGCDKVIVHARKAWLNGLNPKQNRTIPPINYDYVYALKESLPQVPIIINGNISTKESIVAHLKQVDGVMLGRLACDNPYAIAEIHHMLYPNVALQSRKQVLNSYLNYAMKEWNNGVPLSLLFKPLFNFAYGLPGASHWKQQLMEKLKFKQMEGLVFPQEV